MDMKALQALDIHPPELRNWVKAFAEDPQHAFPGHGQKTPEQLEITQLKREVRISGLMLITQLVRDCSRTIPFKYASRC